jgi:hypothetical protein
MERSLYPALIEAMRRIVVLLFVAVLACVAVGFGLRSGSSAGSPSVTTDRPTHLPDRTVTITGSDFVPGQILHIPVTRPDEPMARGDGSGISPAWDSVQADESGDFVYNYPLNGLDGTYTVDVYPSRWGGPGSGDMLLASTTFVDGKYSLKSEAAKLTSYGRYCPPPADSCPLHSRLGDFWNCLTLDTKRR